MKLLPLAALAAMLMLAGGAQAQQVVTLCTKGYSNSSGVTIENCYPVGPNNPLQVQLSGGSGGGSGGTVTVLPTQVTLTNTEVPVAAATSTPLLPANANRKMWRATNDNTGTGCRITYGVPATASLGEPAAPAGAPNGQGGAYTFESSVITLQAINVYCATAGSFAVVEGQ